MPGDEVSWPPPPREPGPWNGGPPVAPPGNTALPPLPGASGTMGGTQTSGHNPWTQQVPNVNIPPDRPDPSAPPMAPLSPRAPKAPIARRAPAWVLAVSVVIVLAMIAGGAYVVLKGGRQFPSEWDAKVEPIATWVSEQRDLEFEHPVKVNFLTEEEYTARSTEGGGDPAEAETAKYYEDQAAQLRALGFLSGDVDLAKANDTLSDSGTLAFYDQEMEQVFVRGTEMTPGVRVTLAHELVHVLQDQHFDLERLGDFEDGRDAVLRALAEGDADRIEDIYVDKELTDEERTAYEKETSSSGDEADEALDDVPAILTTLFASPYILGPELVAALDAKDGNDAIDAALQDPPTEEVLFDPRLFEADAADAMTVDVEAPEGAEVIEESEFGPTAWFLMLSARMDPLVALKAVDGWGGDQYVVYREDDKVCVAANVEMDTEQDVTELGLALTTWVAASPKGSASTSTADGQVRFQSCDPGVDAKAQGDEVTPDTLSVPVTRTQVYVSSLEQDATPAQSSCFAQGVVDSFTYEQLTDPDGTFLASNEGQQILIGLRGSCT